MITVLCKLEYLFFLLYVTDVEGIFISLLRSPRKTKQKSYLINLQRYLSLSNFPCETYKKLAGWKNGREDGLDFFLCSMNEIIRQEGLRGATQRLEWCCNGFSAASVRFKF